MPQVVIRRFQSRDVDDVITLWQQVLPASQPWNEPRTVLCRKTNQHDGLIFVAEQDGLIVGAVMAGYDGVRGWVYRLAVSPEHRRLGIGRRLLDHVESALLSQGCPKINLQVRSANAEVLEFYRRCGYETEGHHSLGKPLRRAENVSADPVPTIPVTREISLSPISSNDKPFYRRHLNETDAFQRNMRLIPYPYTDFDADQWIAKAVRETLAQDHSRNWAIRTESGELIGGIGLMDISPGEMAELGYWLARSYWGRGIMSRSVRCLCSFAFEQYRLQRIHARVLASNARSAHVLAKAAFRLEGTLRNHDFREGQPLDVLIFGRLKDESIVAASP